MKERTPLPKEVRDYILENVASGKIKVATQEQLKECDWHVCGSARMTPECQETTCSQCGKTVWFRDECPPGPKKIRIDCVLKMAGMDSFPA